MCALRFMTNMIIIILFLIGKLQSHPIGIESMTSPSIPLLREEEVPFALELIGMSDVIIIDKKWDNCQFFKGK
jgi:hypothetical protein